MKEFPSYIESLNLEENPIDQHLFVRKNCGLYFAKDLVVFEITGKDSQKLLHSLLSNEINELKEGSGNLHHLLTPKGKVQAEVEVFCLGDFYRLVCQKNQYETLTKNLQMRIFRSDIKIIDRTKDFFILGLYGPKSEQVLKTFDENFSTLRNEYQCGFLKLNGEEIFFNQEHLAGEMGFHLIIPTQKTKEIWETLSQNKEVIAIGEKAMESLKMEAGVPQFGIDFTNENLSLEVNLNKAVSNTKGCYLGQEPVARILSRGHVAKRLVGLILDEDFNEKEVEIWPASDSKKKPLKRSIGKTTRFGFSPVLGKAIAFAMIKYDFLENNSHDHVHLFQGEQFLGKAKIQELPFYREGGINWLEGGPKMKRVVAPQTKTKK